jgi:putative sterol carrier protein
MGFKLPSDEWIKEFGRQINSSKAYEESAKDWEGDFLFIMEADNTLPKTAYFFVGLNHGKSPDTAMIENEKAREAQFTLTAAFSIWRKIIEGKLDPIQAIMTGKLKLKGNLAKVLRYPKSAKELVNCVQRVPTDFPT